MKPTTSWRDPQVKPDIVLLRWKFFIERLSVSLSNRSIVEPPYSESYTGDFCISKTGLDLSWRVVQSTVEIKGLPNRAKLPRDFDKDYWALKETALCTSLNDDAILLLTLLCFP